MGYINFGVPRNLVSAIVSRIPFKYFIETGTFQGGTARWASSCFQEVHTIEVHTPFYEKLVNAPDKPRNLFPHLGNSTEVIPQLLAQMSGHVFFWLDAHYSGSGTGGEAEECPVLEEIRLIASFKNIIPTIFIDDARMFLGPPPPPHKPEQWPRIDQIFATIREYLPEHLTSVQDDVIISAPGAVMKIVDEDWLETYETRFSELYSVKKVESPKRSFFQKVLGAPGS